MPLSLRWCFCAPGPSQGTAGPQCEAVVEAGGPVPQPEVTPGTWSTEVTSATGCSQSEWTAVE